MKDKFWQKAIIILSLLFFLQILGPFSKPGIFLGQDSPLHLVYLTKFEDAVRSGQFPVRLIDWLVPGLAQPIFNFYPPGVSYLFLIPKLLGFEFVTAFKLLIITLWLLSAFLMYLFAKRYFAVPAAILVAYLYLLAPYHILDILVRFALPEFAALAAIPGVFWAIKSYVDTGRGFYLTAISLFIALVTISHPPTTLTFAPLLIVYFLYVVLIEKPSKHNLVPLAAALITGFGLSSFFIVPAYFEKEFVHSDYLSAGKYDFHNHFVCASQLLKPNWGQGSSTPDCLDKMSFQLGLMHWFLVLSAASTLFWKSSTKFRPLLVICLALIAFYILMMTPLSMLIWEKIPYVGLVIYPWRYLAPTIFLASLCAGFVLIVIKNEKVRYTTFILLVIATSLTYKNYLKPVEYAGPNEPVGLGNPEEAYMPRAVQALPAENDRPISELKLATDEAKLVKYQRTPTNKNYLITVEKPTIARFYTQYFPGWKVIVNSKEVTPKSDNIYGYMDLELDPGTKHVNLVFQNTLIRTLANTLSLSFIFISIALAFVFKKKRPN